MTLSEYLDKTETTHESLALAIGSDVSSVTRWAGGSRIPATYFAALIAEVTKGAVPVTVWPPPRRRVSRRNVTGGKSREGGRTAVQRSVAKRGAPRDRTGRA